jgi:hypothetical protein
VLDAHIFGFTQAFTGGSERIEFRLVEFRDDGTDSNGNAPENPAYDARHADRAAGDGIYTAFIPLHGVSAPTEYRVSVQADTTDGHARYIGLDDPNRQDQRITRGDEERRPKDPTLRQTVEDSTEGAEGQALRFQRATSVHFHVKP